MGFNSIILLFEVWNLNKVFSPLPKPAQTLQQHHCTVSLIFLHNTQPHLVNKYCIVLWLLSFPSSILFVLVSDVSCRSRYARQYTLKWERQNSKTQIYMMVMIMKKIFSALLLQYRNIDLDNNNSYMNHMFYRM